MIHTVYINLTKRVDRKRHIESELQRMGLVGERFPAIWAAQGLLGCMKSHLGVLKNAKLQGWESVLILEDDAQFLVSKEELKELMNKITSMDFDVVMLGYNLKKSQDMNESFLKVLEAQTASAYIVHKSFYNTLIDLYEKTIPIASKTFDWDRYANDQVWKQLQPGSRWYATKIRVCRQIPGYSDNTRKFEDYGL